MVLRTEPIWWSAKATTLERFQPSSKYAVVFEDDVIPATSTALDTSKVDNPIVDALQIYNVAP